jgi:hypothetical protein
MARARWLSLLLLLVVRAPTAFADFGLFSSGNSNEPSGKESSKTSTRDERGAKTGEHHPQITVTGADVGVAVSPGPSPKPDEAAAEPALNLLGDLISAASGESNGTLGQVLDKALAKEFEQESKNAESGKGKTYNETVANEEVSRFLACAGCGHGHCSARPAT